MLLRRVEGERDDAKLELRQVKAECKSLRDRLKGLEDGHSHHLTDMEDRLAELQLQLDEVRLVLKMKVFYFGTYSMSPFSFTKGLCRER